MPLAFQGCDGSPCRAVAIDGDVCLLAELLSALELGHLTFAIATSSLPGQVMASVRSLALPAEPAIVDGSHVAHAKPAP